MSWRTLVGLLDPALTCAAAAAALTLWVLQSDGFDFRIFLAAAHAVVHGATPYPVTRAELAANSAFVYPRFAAWLFAPLLLVSASTASTIYTVFGGGCVAAGLRLVEVNRWRWCVPVCLSSYTLRSLTLGTVECLLFVLIAAAWRLRDRPVLAGLLLACAIMVKPVAAPLIIFFLVTRRIRAVTVTAAATVALWLASGGTLGSALSYGRMLHQLAGLEGPGSSSTAAWVASLGVSFSVASAICLIVAVCLLVAVERLPGVGDARVFGIALVAAVLISPIVWSHYYLLVVLAMCIVRIPITAVWIMFASSWFVTPDRRWVISASHYVSWPPNGDGTVIAQALLVALSVYILARAMNVWPLSEPASE